MRPRKKILLLGANELRISVRKFMLDTNGFAVTPAATAPEAFALLRTSRYDLVLCELPFDGVGRVLDQVYDIDPDIRTVMLKPKNQEYPLDVAVSATLADDCPALELLERIKVIVARKRGPRPIRVLSAAAPAWCEQERRLA